MKKAFTLIELLAVIVILAILALIVSPIISGVINDAKKASAERSIEGYIKAVEYAQVQYQYKNGGIITPSVENLTVSAKGIDKITVNNIKFNNSGIVETGSFIVDGYNCTYDKGKTSCVKGNAVVTPTVPTKVYGLRWDGNNTYTRLEDAEGMVANAGVGATPATNDFDNAEIFGEIEDVTVDGNAFVKIPKFYIKKVVIGDTWEWYVSKEKKDDLYYLPECFKSESGNELDYVLIGKYDASLNGTKLESKTGTIPAVSISMDTARIYATNNNVNGVTGYQLLDIHAYDAVQVLFYVEFATVNSQSVMYGYTKENSGKIDNGTTDVIVSSSGSTSSNIDGKSAMKYRGIENLWGNIYQWVDGLYINNNLTENNIFVNKKPSTYANYTGENTQYYYIGYNKINSDVVWISRMGYDGNNPFIQLPKELGGTSSTKYADYYGFNTSGKTVMRIGGAWSDNTLAGLTFIGIGSVSTFTSISVGTRIMKKPL